MSNVPESVRRAHEEEELNDRIEQLRAEMVRHNEEHLRRVKPLTDEIGRLMNCKSRFVVVAKETGSMNKTPEWHLLWAVEPGLKPEADVKVSSADWEFDPQVGKVRAALYRDAAVRWLESQFAGAGIIAWRVDRSTRRAAGTWVIGYHEGYGDFKELGEGPSKDDALFDACKNVIATTKTKGPM